MGTETRADRGTGGGMATCRRYEEWRLRAEPDAPAPRDLDAHLAGCPECRRLRARYEGALDGVREQASGPVPAGPDLAALRAALAAPVRTARPRRAWRPAAAVAGAAALAAGLVVLVRMLDAPAPAPAPGEAREAAGVPGPAQEAAVRPGQWIETEGADVRLSDARVAGVKVGPHTRLQVGSWEAARTVLFLDAGVVDVTVRPLGPDEAFEVRTPLAQVRVVGTRFRTSHRPGVETVVTCLEGEVKVETLAEVELARVRAGFEVRVSREGIVGPRPAVDFSQVPPAGEPLVASLRVAPRPALPVPSPVVAVPGTPPAPAAVIEEARLALTRSQARDAVEVIRRALRDGTPPEPRLLAVLGDALRVAGHPEEARAAYEQSAGGDASAVPEGVLVDLAVLLQEDLGRPQDAERTWWQYLARHPRGRYAAQALGELAARAGGEGRSRECLALRTRLLAEHPSSPEATRALADGGRELLARRDAAAAWDWFRRWRDDPVPSLAETALAGMVQARLQQGLADEARELAAEHLRRFPAGAHAAEIRAFLAGSGTPTEQSPPWR